MTNEFPVVPLRSVLHLAIDTVSVDPLAEYPVAGVYSFGRGLLARAPLKGSETTYKVFHRLHTDDFVLSQLKAWEGALAVVPPSFNGWFLSPQFPTFRVDPGKLDIRYLNWYCKQSRVWELLRGEARGMGARRDSVSPQRFLATPIPLPPLDEQGRIVARIEELAAKIMEARGLRQQVEEETATLFASAINDVWRDQSNWTVKSVREIATTVSGQVDPQIEPYASLPHISGEVMESGTCRLLPYRLAKDDGITSGKYHFRPGSILYSKIRPYLKKAVQVPVEGICSADVYAFDTIDFALEPRFFMYSLISPGFTEYANRLSGRTRMPKLNQEQVFAFHMSYPSLSDQRRIVAYLDNLQTKLDALKRIQGESANELNALLPSVLDKAFKHEL